MEGMRVKLWYPEQRIMSAQLDIWNLPEWESLDEKPTVLASTQQQDKNGKNIFEGDYVEVIEPPIDSRFKGEVIFNELVSMFMVKTNLGVLHEINIASDCTIELLGNVYENPELTNRPELLRQLLRKEKLNAKIVGISETKVPGEELITFQTKMRKGTPEFEAAIEAMKEGW